jgi:hypothetical protein
VSSLVTCPIEGSTAFEFLDIGPKLLGKTSTHRTLFVSSTRSHGLVNLKSNCLLCPLLALALERDRCIGINERT